MNAATSFFMGDDDDDDGEAPTTTKANNNNNHVQTVWVEAEAGVGKSTLINQFRSRLVQQKYDQAAVRNDKEASSFSSSTSPSPTLPLPLSRPCICEGKFEELFAASEPFAALSDCIGELVTYILSSSSLPLRKEEEEEREEFAQGILDAVGTADWQLLIDILPALKRLSPLLKLQTDEITSSSKSGGAQQRGGAGPSGEEFEESFDWNLICNYDAFGDFVTKEWRFDRFRFAFRQLIRFCASKLLEKKQPLVFILDDFHFVDSDSLQIVKTLITTLEGCDGKRGVNRHGASIKYPNFLLVLASRPIDDYRRLQELYRYVTAAPQQSSEIPSKSASQAFTSYHSQSNKILTVGVPRLSMLDIETLLRKLLRQNGRNDDYVSHASDKVADLAEVVKNKTQGNSFVVQQFLRRLERSGHFQFDPIVDEWTFDLHQIVEEDAIGHNVTDVVRQNLNFANKKRKSALMVAASFGVSRFDLDTIVHAVKVLDADEESKGESTISTAMDSLQSEEDDHNDPYNVQKRTFEMCSELSIAAEEGYVQEMSPGHYRFAHDRIRESAYSLLPSGDQRNQVHLKVGRQLRSWMDTQSELGLGSGFSSDSLLLHATKQLNSGSVMIQDQWELIDLVDMNYQAAELAAHKTAFFSAMEYLRVGFKHLGKDAWETNYDRALKFCNALTRVQYACGLLRDSWYTSDFIIRQGKTFQDQRLAYHTRILCLIQEQKMDDALSLLLDCFELLGRPMPRRFVMLHGMSDYMTVRKIFKHTTDAELVSLPSVNDINVETYSDFLEKLGEIGWLGEKPAFLFLYMFRYLRLVFEVGHFKRSFVGILSWAWMQTQFMNLKDGNKYCDLALELGEKNRRKEPASFARCEMSKYGFISHWLIPIRETLRPLEKSFTDMWSHGSVDIVLMDRSLLLQQYFVVGESLSTIQGECSKFGEAFIDFDHMMHWYISAPQCQAVLNFIGDKDNQSPSVLHGSYLDMADFHSELIRKPNPIAQYQFHFWSTVVSYHFHDFQVGPIAPLLPSDQVLHSYTHPYLFRSFSFWQAAKKHIKSMRKGLYEEGPCPLVTWRIFYTGLVYCALTKETSKAKYLRRAKAAYRQLKQWTEKGAVNCFYMVELFDAEFLVLNGRTCTSDVMAAYTQAIASAETSGLTHHAALGNELLGSHLHQLDNGKGMAGKSLIHLRTACLLYKKWGAFAKVDHLSKSYNMELELTSLI